ncbi:hypothetical protein BsWGS_19748 [Bradybaena similaris]
MYRSLFFTCVLVGGCAIWTVIDAGMGRIPGVNCTQTDIVNMMGRCMLKFTHGHSAPVIAKMRKSLRCDRKLINCGVVMETRVCLADLSKKELSQPCKSFIDQVADYQFGVFNIPCRVRHLRETCRDFFFQHGLTQF